MVQYHIKNQHRKGHLDQCTDFSHATNTILNLNFDSFKFVQLTCLPLTYLQSPAQLFKSTTNWLLLKKYFQSIVYH